MTDTARKPAIATRIAAVALMFVLLLAMAGGYLYWWRHSHYVNKPTTVFVDLRTKAVTGSFIKNGKSEDSTADVTGAAGTSGFAEDAPGTAVAALATPAAAPAPTTEAPGYIAFCSRFSENPVGIPGHGFVLWSNRWPPPALALCDTSGFYPSQYFDQFVAILKPVKGVFVKEPLSQDQECLEYSLVAIVDPPVYKRSLAVRDEWKKRAQFKLYSSDCVNFVDAIAASVGLRRPDRARLFPQDYVNQLRNLNSGSRTN